MSKDRFDPGISRIALPLPNADNIVRESHGPHDPDALTGLRGSLRTDLQILFVAKRFAKGETEVPVRFTAIRTTLLDLQAELIGSQHQEAAALKPDSGSWRDAVARPDLVEEVEVSREITRERMASLGISPNRSSWQDVIQAPGFDEAWARARQQSRAGEEVSADEIRRLEVQDESST